MSDRFLLKTKVNPYLNEHLQGLLFDAGFRWADISNTTPQNIYSGYLVITEFDDGRKLLSTVANDTEFSELSHQNIDGTELLVLLYRSHLEYWQERSLDKQIFEGFANELDAFKTSENEGVTITLTKKLKHMDEQGRAYYYRISCSTHPFNDEGDNADDVE